MRYLKYVVLLGIVVAAAGTASAQVRVQFGIGGGPVYYGPPPSCVYGYYDYYPYACAPYGYYGPDYFAGGVFIGAGPWYRGYRGRAYYPAPYAYRGRTFDNRGFQPFNRGRSFTAPSVRNNFQSRGGNGGGRSVSRGGNSVGRGGSHGGRGR
jgi:hypothetical protein